MGSGIPYLHRFLFPPHVFRLEKFEDRSVLVFFHLQPMVTINVTSHQSSLSSPPKYNNDFMNIPLPGKWNPFRYCPLNIQCQNYEPVSPHSKESPLTRMPNQIFAKDLKCVSRFPLLSPGSRWSNHSLSMLKVHLVLLLLQHWGYK